MRDKAFDIAKNQRGLASMVYNYFDNKSSGSGIKNENMTNKELAEEIVIKNVKNTVPWTYIIGNLNKKSKFGMFYENCKNQMKKSWKSNEEKKRLNFMLNRKATMVPLMVGFGFIKKI